MNQNDDKNKKDPDERDPFNFFKLSPEPSNNNNNKDQKKQYRQVAPEWKVAKQGDRIKNIFSGCLPSVRNFA